MRHTAPISAAILAACIGTLTIGGSSVNASEPSHSAPEDPSLAVMNNAHEHSLGATFAEALPTGSIPTDPASPWIRGMDISYWQGPASQIDWQSAVDRGAAFTYVKASEGSYGGIATRYAEQRQAAQAEGLFTGSYHFANPNSAYASASDQARLFAGYSARWRTTTDPLWAADQHLLPPMLDLEWNPYPEDGDACYDLTPPQMVNWVHEFLATATALFGRPPVLYTSTSWWKLCTGNSPDFGSYPLSLARYTPDKAGGPGELPAGWDHWTFWQHGNDSLDYTGKGDRLPGDQQFFRSTAESALEAFSSEAAH